MFEWVAKIPGNEFLLYFGVGILASSEIVDSYQAFAQSRRYGVGDGAGIYGSGDGGDSGGSSDGGSGCGGCAECMYVQNCGGGLACLAYACYGKNFMADPGCWYANHQHSMS